MTSQQVNAIKAYHANMTAANARALIKATPLTEATAEALNALPAIDRVALAIASQIKQLHDPKSDLYKNDILSTIVFANLTNLLGQSELNG